MLTPSNPILLSGCDNIKFAPFNSSYPNIDEDANASGLSNSLNLWDKPIVVAQNQSLHGSHWSLMDPNEFSLLAVPVDTLPAKGQHNSSELVNRANVKRYLCFFSFLFCFYYLSSQIKEPLLE